MTSSKYSERYLGKSFKSNNCGNFEVILYKSAREVKIRFKKTGYETWTRSSLVDTGEVRDTFSPSLYNVGFIGKGRYTTGKKSEHSKAYKCWSHMLERCYSKNFHSSSAYRGRGVHVCKMWHNYQVFAEWYYENYKEGTEIDKDLSGKSFYSPETCCFLPKSINSALTINRGFKRELPVGVSLRKDCKGYISSITLFGKRKHLGVFETEQSAFEVYKVSRKNHLVKLGKDALSKGQITEDIFDKIKNIEIVPYPQ